MTHSIFFNVGGANARYDESGGLYVTNAARVVGGSTFFDVQQQYFQDNNHCPP